MCQRGGDHPAGLAAGAQAGRVGASGPVAVPQPDAKVQQGTTQRHRAFSADGAVVAAAGGGIHRGRQSGGPVELVGGWPAGKVADGGAVAGVRTVAQPGTLESTAKGVAGSSAANRVWMV
jgi:hypothetical protein